MHPQIERDPLYKRLYLEGGDALVTEAGFFVNNCPKELDLEEATNIPCTPVQFIKDNMVGAKNPCVLLSTGGFAPIHSGHINMMIGAKVAAENAGYTVVGGFFAPDHDEYIGRKIEENEHYSIGKRIYLINKAIQPLKWLRVDPWAGIFQTHTINFTDILTRLKLYLKKHGINVPVFFVAGGDNAGFALPFEKEGHCIIVSRPGYDTKLDKYKYLVDGKRILLGYNEDNNSSTLVRKLKGIGGQEEVDLLLRMTSLRSPIEQNIYEELKKHYRNVYVHDVEAQRKQLQEVTGNIISLDPLISSKYNLAISRNYDLFGMNLLGFVNRPKHPSLEEQISKIPKGAYKLYDDDIHSGYTMDYVSNLLAAHDIDIVEKFSFTRSKDGQEVLDARDFIYDSYNCGLVVNDERVPYIYPYVNPYERASVADPMGLSVAMWEINVRHYNSISEDKYYKSYQNYQLLMKYAKKAA